jgi:hypothetical protein
MCTKCEQITEAVARYRRLKGQIIDQRTIEAADSLLAKLEAEKLSLHPKE